MLTFILMIIYLAFISLGLPDSLLGSAWPIMRVDLQMPFSAAGIISMIITGSTIISSFLSGKIIKRFGTGKVTSISVLMTAISLFGFSFSISFYWICLLAILLGLGAGAVDSGLNNFVALHYKAKHMSWLHCFWGIGATAGPLIMSLFLAAENGWRKGYLLIASIQFVLVFILFLTLPIWRNFEINTKEDLENNNINNAKKSLFSMPIVKVTLVSFFCYCAIEMTTGLWGSSYLVDTKDISADVAAKWVSLFYLGVTVGRLFAGFISMKINPYTLIRLGEVTIMVGIILFILPFNPTICMVGFILVGLGCAPIFPCMLHDTPNKVGKNFSQSMMGIQMAFAYMGSTLMPPIFGVLATIIDTSIFPVYIFILLIVMVVCVEKTNKLLKGEQK
ncbi:MFS transporter [Marinisporobacter balticus]|uniref:Fucose permease n=1 Tax=Marinisporobacter balticus TaxID=2018667 RepID=A0A4R2KFB9_9FIRM|nr:MFS transporter [Marinisporobacter balticus]TCO69066.1 fucose permease [Marinisporobacter balticus]